MVLFLLAGVTVGSILAQSRREIRTLKLPETGEMDRTVSLSVVREDGSREQMNLRIEAPAVTEEEAEKAFSSYLAAIPESILGDNPSPDTIADSLALPEKDGSLGLKLEWTSSRPDLLSSRGDLVEDRLQEEPETVMLTLRMICGDFVREHEILLRVLPPNPPTWAERLAEVVEAGVTEEGRLILPTEFEGESIAFFESVDLTKILAVFALLLSIRILIYTKGKGKNGNRDDRKKHSIDLQYPELITRITVLCRAGLSLRSVWLRMAADIEKQEKKITPLESEVVFTAHLLSEGISEGEAYRRFGQRCGTAGCLRLGNLMAAGLRRGNAGMLEQLAEESNRVWELRKHQARRRGEKNETLLLIPMFLEFAVILTLVCVPAFAAFQW